MARARVFIFARRPVLGQVKTRLATAIGDERALNFYEETLRGICSRLSTPEWDLDVAITPDEEGELHGVRMQPQGAGDLGERLMRCLREARPDAPVAVVGSDIPDLNAWHVRDAVAALGHANLVLGPALDGGFWLIGASCKPPATLFASVRWSTEHALADTLANASSCSIAMLERLEDVDEEAAYQRHVSRQL